MMEELLVYGSISPYAFDASADGVAELLRRAGPAGAVRVRVHSPGGDPLEAAAMATRLEQHTGPVEIVVDGLAASAAARLLTTRRARVLVSARAQVMIHRTTGGLFGHSEDLHAAGNMVDSLDAQAAQAYAARTGLSVDEVAAMMRATTWMDAEEAVAKGFADEVIEPLAALAAQVDMGAYNLRSFANVPEPLAAACDRNTRHLTNPCEGDPMNPTEIRKRLRLPESATDAEVFAALDAVSVPAPAPAVEPTPVAGALSTEALAQVAEIVRSTVNALAPAPAPAAPPEPAPAPVDTSAAHALAASACVDRHIRELKIRPADRGTAIKACGDSVGQLNAMNAYWTAQPPLVAAALDAPAPGASDDLSPMAKRMAEAAGLTLDQIRAVKMENAQ